MSGGNMSSVSRDRRLRHRAEPSLTIYIGYVLQPRGGQGQGASATMGLRRLRPWLQRVISGYQLETLNLLSSQYEGREMKCIQRS
jgi:hypothetical protein